MLDITTVLVTGATGKLGGPLCKALVREGYSVVAAVHHNPIDVEGVRTVPLDLSDYGAVESVVAESDAVLHLASAKETREALVDVSVRGTFHLLDASLRTRKPKRFVLAGGDCVNGIYFKPSPAPITEAMPMTAYPGYYALSKVMEETLTTQYFHQEKVPIVNLRMSWIQAEDDILSHLCLEGEPFGVPVWREIMTAEQRREFAPTDGEPRRNAAVAAIHPDGTPLRRHVVALEDCVQAFLLALHTEGVEGQTFNIAMGDPFDYREAARYVADRLGIELLELTDPIGQDFCMDITKARFGLGFEPAIDIRALIDRAIDFRRAGTPRRRRAGYAG